MRDLFTRLNITGFDAVGYINTHSTNTSALPNIALAFSGGGYRAMLNGAGALKAFDSRTVNTTGPGQLGGLLQSATYVAGLSGGGWLVGSVYVNNFTSISALQTDASGSLWALGNSVLQGPAHSGISILNTADYYVNLEQQVSSKSSAGYNTTITDYWSVARD